jgi:hypothetical protein
MCCGRAKRERLIIDWIGESVSLSAASKLRGMPDPIQKARYRFPDAGSILAMMNICP